MNARSSFTFSSFALALGLALAACGDGGGSSSSSSSSSSGGDSSSSSSSGAMSDVEVGKAFATENGCAGCHSPDYAGGTAAIMGVYPPNITPDKDTGIGDWADDEIKKAIQTGVDDEGKKLCSSMKRYEATDKQITGLVAYLRSLPAVSKKSLEGACTDK